MIKCSGNNTDDGCAVVLNPPLIVHLRMVEISFLCISSHNKKIKIKKIAKQNKEGER